LTSDSVALHFSSPVLISGLIVPGCLYCGFHQGHQVFMAEICIGPQPGHRQFLVSFLIPSWLPFILAIIYILLAFISSMIATRPETRFGLVIWFTEHLQLTSTSNYNTGPVHHLHHKRCPHNFLILEEWCLLGCYAVWLL
jgi:hypothetical protein